MQEFAAPDITSLLVLELKPWLRRATSDYVRIARSRGLGRLLLTLDSMRPTW